MSGVFKQFDSYTLRARVFPALIAGLPTLAMLFFVIPWDRLGISHLIASTMAIVLLVAFADVARRAGRNVETILGTRATPELWYRTDNAIDSISKERYRAFMGTKLQVSPPTEQDEISNPAQADQFYLSAGFWLRDHTRDTKKFKLLYEELLTYGFRRNLLGLKPVALCLNAIVAILCLAAIVSPVELPIHQSIERLTVVIVAVVLHSAYMIFAVGKQAVREASRSYGVQLIASCETLLAPPRRSSPNKKST
ncbi:hypothetical protein [Phyllobacterium sophorae]|uniref:Uncharacterized protein n=1 Tax=Phyllobacterium sophorae TaxID=1520277 RepID=A0A2P7B6Y6_9HYPH|nr:hypothetical protein [Phyllobacterium sophorae]PSH62222.1 hypothetical protein CU103_20600 [Phyllobacterium sophorae]